MADKKIDDVELVTSVGGTERVPASVGGSPKTLTTEQVKDYILAAVAALSGVNDWTPASGESLLIKKTEGSATVNRYVTFVDLVTAVFNALIGKEAATTLTDADVISIQNGSVAKTVTVGSLKTYISSAFSGNMDIHGLTAADGSDTSDELAAYKSGTVNANRKVTVTQLASAVVPKVATLATQETTAIGSADEIIIARQPATAGGDPTLVKVPLQNAGLGITNGVTGPGNTTENKIPQWDEDDRVLKNGLSLVTGVGSSSADTEVPTAKAVYEGIVSAVNEKVTGPSTATDGNIVQFDGTTGKLVKGGMSVATSISSDASASKIPTEAAVRNMMSTEAVTVTNVPLAGAIPVFTTASVRSVDAQALSKTTSVRSTQQSEDTKIPTERAVANALDGKISKPSSVTSGKVPTWDGTGGNLADGYSVLTSIGQTPSDGNIVTEKCVSDALGSKAAAPSITTNGNIPQWDSTQKTLKNGLGVVTSIGNTGSDTNIPTEKAVASKFVARPSSITDGNIPQWDDTTGKLKDGLGLRTTTIREASSASESHVTSEMSVRAAIDDLKGDAILGSGTPVEGAIPVITSSGIKTASTDTYTKTTTVNANPSLASDTKFPTEKAVSTRTSGMVRTSSDTTTTTENKIPQWGGTSGTMKDGLELVTEIVSTSTDAQVPTAEAVLELVSSSHISTPGSVVEGNIPLWGDTNNKLTAGLSVVTNSVSSLSTDSEIPTARAINTQFGDAAIKSGTHTSGAAVWNGQGNLVSTAITTSRADKSDTARITSPACVYDTAWWAAGLVAVKISASIPTTSTVARVGTLLYCTTSHEIYICTSSNSTTGTVDGTDFSWVKILNTLA